MTPAAVAFAAPGPGHREAPDAATGAASRREGAHDMDARTLARTLVVVGGLNWGLVGLARFDLVATLTGKRFGGTNAATRLVYLAVGAAAVVEGADLLEELRS